MLGSRTTKLRPDRRTAERGTILWRSKQNGMLILVVVEVWWWLRRSIGRGRAYFFVWCCSWRHDGKSKVYFS